MAMEGMDVEVVTGLHTQMSSLSQQLESIVTTMPGVVNHLEAAWRGADASRFVSEWPTYQGQLQNALHALQAITQTTFVNLQQQEQASA